MDVTRSTTRTTRKGPVKITKTAVVELDPDDLKQAVAQYVENEDGDLTVDPDSVTVLYNDDNTCLIVSVKIEVEDAA